LPRNAQNHLRIVPQNESPASALEVTHGIDSGNPSLGGANRNKQETLELVKVEDDFDEGVK